MGYLVAVQPHLVDLRLRELAVVEHPARGHAAAVVVEAHQKDGAHLRSKRAGGCARVYMHMHMHTQSACRRRIKCVYASGEAVLGAAHV